MKSWRLIQDLWTDFVNKLDSVRALVVWVQAGAVKRIDYHRYFAYTEPDGGITEGVIGVDKNEWSAYVACC